MPVNEYLAWATGVGAIVTPQSSYATNAALILGNTVGIADPALANKTWRQATVPAAAWGQFINNRAQVDALDDGNIAAYVTNLEAAIRGYAYSGITPLARIRLTADTTFYVGGTGANDANPGTSLSPWATLQHAAAVVNAQYDIAGFNVTYQCQGAFSAGIGLHAPQVGATSAQGITFNFAPGSSISVVNSSCVFAEFGASFLIQGQVTLTSTGTSGVAAGYGAFAGLGGNILVGDQVIFNTCSLSHAFGNVSFVGPSYSIIGSSPAHIMTFGNLSIGYFPATFGGHVTVTLTGSPAFSSAFAYAFGGGKIVAASTNVVYVGAGTGPRYFANTGGQIATFGGGASFFPTPTAGTADGATFGLYT